MYKQVELGSTRKFWMGGLDSIHCWCSARIFLFFHVNPAKNSLWSNFKRGKWLFLHFSTFRCWSNLDLSHHSLAEGWGAPGDDKVLGLPGLVSVKVSSKAGIEKWNLRFRSDRQSISPTWYASPSWSIHGTSLPGLFLWWRIYYPVRQPVLFLESSALPRRHSSSSSTSFSNLLWLDFFLGNL